MTGLDIIVLALIVIGAVGGFLRGFVQEILSLLAWILALFAINRLHTPITDWLLRYMDSPSGAAVLAFALLLLIPYAGMKLIARRMGEASRNSLLGPVDRALGIGFGIIKGVIIAVLAFSVLMLGYDTVWGVAGRPGWMTTARSYPFINAAADELVVMIQERRKELAKEDAGPPGRDKE